jgi:hypothetical protein
VVHFSEVGFDFQKNEFLRKPSTTAIKGPGDRIILKAACIILKTIYDNKDDRRCGVSSQ